MAKDAFDTRDQLPFLGIHQDGTLLSTGTLPLPATPEEMEVPLAEMEFAAEVHELTGTQPNQAAIVAEFSEAVERVMRESSRKGPANYSSAAYRANYDRAFDKKRHDN